MPESTPETAVGDIIIGESSTGRHILAVFEPALQRQEIGLVTSEIYPHIQTVLAPDGNIKAIVHEKTTFRISHLRKNSQSDVVAYYAEQGKKVGYKLRDTKVHKLGARAVSETNRAI